MSKKKSLKKEDIVSESGMSRRSMLGVVGGGLALGATSVVLGSQSAKADNSTELVTDSDTGNHADPADKPRSGHTDRDTQGGPDGSGDPGGYGVCRRRGHSDSDSGGGADPGGQGRGPCR